MPEGSRPRIELTAEEVEADVKSAVDRHEYRELEEACELIERMSRV